MKTLAQLLCSMIILVSCTKPTQDSNNITDTARDSLAFVHAEEMALQIANQNIHTKYFVDTLETISDDHVLLNTNLKLHEISDRFYLIIHRELNGTVYTELYIHQQDAFKKLFSTNLQALTFTMDTLFDVNGDGHEDFLINWYAASGCCLKNFYHVYLSKGDETFTQKYEFINPTFSPSEKIIRGVCYGHPGETEMYKYRWNDYTVDTIEYIYPNPEIKGEYIKSRVLPWHRKKDNKLIKLKTVPDEYLHIYGYDWFIGYI